VSSADRPELTALPQIDSRWVDRSLIATITATAGLLACQELFDADSWWHLRAAQWILANRRLPGLDPFSFGSAERPWIDLQWAFQVLLALVYRAGSVPGMILLASVASSTTLLIVLCATVRGPRSWFIALIWLPALLLLTTRVQPRPEVFSLLFTSTYLAVLNTCDRRPGWAWLLPPLQVVWVNVHSLFIIGPILLAAYLAEGGNERWRRVGLVLVAVVAACLVNPYGLRGALFPLELLPKITAWGGPYKAYIGEFHDPIRYMQNEAVAVATRNLFCRIEFFLFLMIAISFLAPGIWLAWSAASPPGAAPPYRERGQWYAGLASAVFLAILATLTFPLDGVPVWLTSLGRWLPLSFPVLAFAGAAVLVRRSARAALLAACGGTAVGAAILWLRTQWIAPGAGDAARSASLIAGTTGWVALPAAVLSLVLLLGAGGRLFRLILSAAFGFLVPQAVRNASVFALVSGFVITTNLNDWFARLEAECPATTVGTRFDRAAGTVLTVLLWLAIGAAAAGWLSPEKWGLFPIGLRERPLTFAHTAARFAGCPGMPKHALVFELAQAAVYLFHNAPESKPFIDPRLEVPTQRTFETYVQLDQWLNVGHPARSEVIGRMGNPLILLDHAKNRGAEATLLIDPRWRCVHFDAVASVFLPRSRADLEPLCPTIDFVARHFQRIPLAAVTGEADEARGEARGLVLIGLALLHRREATWMHRIPLMLLAGDRGRAAVAQAPADGRAWLALGDALWSQAPDLLNRPPGPAGLWDPARSLSMAQATVAYRRTVALDPTIRSARSTLRKAYVFRGMDDAQGPVTSLPSWRTVSELRELVEDLLRTGRPRAAVALLHEADERRIALPWGVVDRVAITHLHLGEADAARKLWQRTQDDPSPALRLTRIAEAQLVALDYEASRGMFHAALNRDRSLGEAWYGLALLHLQEGHDSETVRACREGLTCSLTEPQRAALENMKALAARFARPGSD
jgi:hypothetical protein